MTTNTAPKKSIAQRLGMNGIMIIVGMLVYIGVSSAILIANPEIDPRFRLSFDPVLSASIYIKIHVAGALTSFFTGLIILLSPKGQKFHKTLGWVWVIAMAITAISSFFITGIMGKWYSPIHALSAWTVIGLPLGIAAVRRRDIKTHRASMTGMFVGGMVIAGLFTFMPGRLMWSVFFAS